MLKLTLTELDRFWSKVNKTESCWLWTASTRMGYGAFKLKGSVWSAHRLIWLITNGEIPFWLEVCHTCNDRLCVNPEHLYLGTRSDNVKDSVKAKTHSARQKRILSEEAVEQIRQLNKQGVGQRRLAQAFGVPRQNIQRIVQSKTYQD